MFNGCPADPVEVEVNADGCVFDGTIEPAYTAPTVTDACDGTITPVRTGLAPTATYDFQLGGHLVSYVAEDAAGNDAECYFRVVVTDETVSIIKNVNDQRHGRSERHRTLNHCSFVF